MKAEYVHSALQGAQPPASDDAGVGLLQRERDGCKVGAEFRCGRIRRTIDDRPTKGDDMVKLARRLSEARIHSGDGASIGFLTPRGGGIVGRVGKRRKFLTHRGEIGGKRQFGAQLVQFVQIVADRSGALQPHRLVQHVGGDERIAVPVATDPRPDAEERADRLRPRLAGHRVESVLDRAVEARQLMEERIVVEREGVGDLVDDLKLRLAQEVRAPEDEHGPPKPFLVERKLILVAACAFALVEQFRDLEFPSERALAPDFGRMGGKHWAYQRVIEEVGERFRLDAHLAGTLKRVGEGTGARRRAGDRMGAVAADVMLIFGDVGEVREIAVGASDRERLLSVEAVERRLELAPRADLVVAMEAYRSLADLLDQLEDLFALLLANSVAEDPAKQTNVFAQGNVLLVRRARGPLLDFGGHGHRRIRRLEEDRCCTAANTGARPAASWTRRAQFGSQVSRHRSAWR